MEIRKVRMSIGGQPTGARVFLYGQEIGTAPLSVDVYEGEHPVILKDPRTDKTGSARCIVSPERLTPCRYDLQEE